MTTTTILAAAVVPVAPVFTEPEWLARAGFLASRTGLTCEAYTLGLRQLVPVAVIAVAGSADAARARATQGRGASELVSPGVISMPVGRAGLESLLQAAPMIQAMIDGSPGPQSRHAR